MKKIIALLVITVSICKAYAQEDTSRYFKYPSAYGVAYPRQWATKILRTPFSDTSAINAQPGAIQAGLDGKPYWWNGVKWSNLGTAADLTAYVKYTDSLLKYVTPTQLADSTNSIRSTIGLDNVLANSNVSNRNATIGTLHIAGQSPKITLGTDTAGGIGAIIESDPTNGVLSLISNGGAVNIIGQANLGQTSINGADTYRTWLAVRGSVQNVSSMRIEVGTVPATDPQTGDIYNDGSHLYIRLGGLWKQLDGGGGLTLANVVTNGNATTDSAHFGAIGLSMTSANQYNGAITKDGKPYINNYFNTNTGFSAGNEYIGINAGSFIEDTTTHQQSGIQANQAFGDSSLMSLVTGYANTFGGYKAAQYLRTGYSNTGWGYMSYNLLDSGYGNTGVGTYNFGNLIKGVENAGMGWHFLLNLSNGDKNTGMGALAGSNMTTGNRNLFFGDGAGAGVTSGNDNMFFGTNSGPGAPVDSSGYFDIRSRADALLKLDFHSATRGVTANGTLYTPQGINSTGPVLIQRATPPQLQIGYDANNYFTTAVLNNGSTTFSLQSNVTTQPRFTFGNTVLFNRQIAVGGTSYSSPAWGVSGVLLKTLPGITITDSTTATGATVSTITPLNTISSDIIGTANTGITYTTSPTLYIQGAPTCTGCTITNPYSLYVNSGNTYMGGSLGLGSGITNNGTAVFRLGGNFTSNSMNSRGVMLQLEAATITDNAPAGSFGYGGMVSFKGGTVNETSAVTATDLATVIADGAPTAGTNLTATNTWAFLSRGAAKFSAGVTFSSFSTGVAHLSSTGVLSSSLVANADLATMAANTVKGVTTAGTPTDLTVEQLSVPKVVATGNLTGQTTSGNVVTYTTGAADSSFMISGYITVTGYTSGSVGLQVTYTYETNTSRTQSFYNMTGTGTLSSTLNAAGKSNYTIMGQLRVKASTTITVATTGTFSATFNAGAKIIKTP